MKKSCFDSNNNTNCNNKPNIPCTINYIGVIGPTGPTGATGPASPSGIIGFADFYALMLPDNAATVALEQMLVSLKMALIAELVFLEQAPALSI